MSRFRFARFRPLVRLSALCLMPLLSGCLAAAAIGGGASIGYVSTEDRSMRENIDDTVICANISKSWVAFNSQLNDDLDCHSYQARVLVTGRVPSNTWRDAAIGRANQVQGVKEVYDEATVGPGSSFTNGMHDVYITQHLKAELLTDSQIHSNNYIVTTTDSVVYVIGTARDQAEIDRVVDYARNLSGVKHVVSYIRIRASAPITAGPDNANDTNAAGDQTWTPGDTAPDAPTPRGDIVVTPLQAPQSPAAPSAPAAPPRGNAGSAAPQGGNTGPAAPQGGNTGPAAPQGGNTGVTPLK